MKRSLTLLWQDMIASKHYLIAACIVFVTSWVLGATGDQYSAFLQGSSESMGQIAQRIAQSDHPQLYFFLFIFANNAIKTVLFIYMGAFLGIWPLTVLVINGMMIGYLLETHPSGEPLMLFVKGILPHGILELPAILIACAYGIRFGGVLVKAFFSLPSPERRARAGAEITHFLKMTLPLSVALVIVLLVAAVIESTVTFALMS